MGEVIRLVRPIETDPHLSATGGRAVQVSKLVSSKKSHYRWSKPLREFQSISIYLLGQQPSSCQGAKFRLSDSKHLPQLATEIQIGKRCTMIASCNVKMTRMVSVHLCSFSILNSHVLKEPGWGQWFVGSFWQILDAIPSATLVATVHDLEPPLTFPGRLIVKPHYYGT